VDSAGSGEGPVAGSCECGDEPSGSGTTELVSPAFLRSLVHTLARRPAILSSLWFPITPS
jgi:hypothetical protein